MKRKSSSSHYWISTDSGTTYSARNANARHWEKRAKRDEMRQLHRELPEGTAARELLMPRRVEARYQRMKARQARRKAPYKKKDDTSSGSSHFSEPRPVTRRRVVTSGAGPSGMDYANAALSTANYTQAGYTAGGLAGLAVGGPAGAAIGEGVGAVGGAIYGAVTNYNALPKKKMGSRKSVTNAAVNRSTMSKSGKTKVKKMKTVKVSPYLKKAIKQTLVGQQAKGFYQRTIGGLIGSVVNTTAFDGTGPTTKVMGVAGQLGAYYAGRNAGNSAGQKTWWNVLGAAGNGTARTAFAFQTDRDLNFFTPGKIWHAASVLFNNKPENQDPYTGKDLNLKTMFNQTTGDVSNALAVSAQGLKINVLHSKVDFQFKNLSARTIELDVYECMPKLKFAPEGPLTDLLTSITSVQDSSTGAALDRTIGWYVDNAAKDGSASNFLLEGTADAVAIVSKLGWQWTYVKRTMILQPQEICKHSMNGPSGMLDFAKLLNPLSDDIHYTALKNWSKCVVISVRLDPVGTYHTTAASTVTDYGLRYTVIPSAGDTGACMSGQVSVEAEESYRIAVPEIAGFQTVAIAGGAATPSTAQTLNYRKTKMQFTNLLQPNVGMVAGQTLMTAREENAADITSSVYSL